MRDREILLSRRRALFLAAAASTVACPKACLSLAEPCLSVAPEECPVRVIVFKGPATALDAEANPLLDQLVADTAPGRILRLASRLFDDGHAATAEGLREPRLRAVEEALRGRGVPADQLARMEAAPLVPAEEWQRLTGDGNPLTQSGIIQVEC